MKTNQFNLIFDFDGTLIDSFEMVIKKFSLLANEYNFQKVDTEELETLKNLTSKELINHLKIPFYKLPKVLQKAREYLKKEIPFLSIFADLPEVLNELRHLNCVLGILTSNSQENVSTWLDQYNLQHLFHFIHAESSYFGKQHLLKKIMKSHAMDLTKTFYIGDETRDIDAAKECQIQSIAVSWGFNSETVLLRHEPGFLVKKPKELLDIVKRQRMVS